MEGRRGALGGALILQVFDLSNALGAVDFVAGPFASIHVVCDFVADGALVFLEGVAVGDVVDGAETNGYFCGLHGNNKTWA